MGGDLDALLSGRKKSTALSGRAIAANTQEILRNGGNLAGAAPQLDQYVHKLAGESGSFSEFQDKGGTAALAAFATALNLSTDEVRKLLVTTKREIEIKGALNRANQRFDSESLHIADIVNHSQLSVEASQRRLNVANATGSLNVNAISFEQSFGPESAALKAAERSIPGIVRKVKQTGSVENVLGDLPPGIAGHFADALNDFHDTAATARPEDIRNALTHSVAEQQGNVQAGINASRERLAARQQEHAFA